MISVATLGTSVKLAGITGGLGLIAIETIGQEPDLMRYAITQGGLLMVVLVLLWSYRRDWTEIAEQRRAHITILTGLVQQSAVAQTKYADSQVVMARSMEEMTRTVSRITGPH